MSKRLHIYAMLLVATLLFMAGCGGNSGTTFSEADKTAKVSLSFQFPEEGDAGKAVISDATTHILINAWQWNKKSDGTLEKVNFVRKVIDKANPTATLDLLPTYTNICATQWSGNPNELTSQKLETVCSFGLLKPGLNQVNLRMIRGTWNLAQGYTFGNFTTLAFMLYRHHYWSDDYSYETDRFLDTVYYSGMNNSSNEEKMAKMNYGSVYNVAFKTNKGYYIPPFDFEASAASIGGYSNFFNTDDVAPAFFVAKDESVASIPMGYAFFSLPKKTDTDGWYRETKEFIETPGYHGPYNNSNTLILVKRAAEIKIEQWNGSSYATNVTSTLLDPCVPNSVSANSMTLCAGKITSPTAFANYSGQANSYKITVKGIISGVDICYDHGYAPILDASGNPTGCYDYNAWINYDPNATPYCVSGTWNSTNYRCEFDLQTACSQLGGTWANGGCTNVPYYSTLGELCGRINAGPGNYNWYDSYNNVCYNYGIKGTIACENGGNYDSVTGKCVADLQTACYGGTIPDPHAAFDSATNTCTYTDVGYVSSNDLVFTPVTATGVGKLEAGVNFTAAKASSATSKKIKLNFSKRK